MNFAVIIGTEILNGRREDKHFLFLRNELLKRGYSFDGSFLIKDDENLMRKTFDMIKSIPNAKMFCFGGIGSTPDDYTRKISSEIFSDGMKFNEEFKQVIDKKFPNEDNSKKYQLANWPNYSKPLRNNPINGFFGYYIDDKYYFMPGFPEMAQPMIIEILDKFFPQKEIKKRYSILVKAKESELLEIMKQIPKNIEFSSLPKMDYTCEISLVGNDAEKWIEFFKKELKEKKIIFENKR